MGTLQLILKQMRQRALGTWLTLLSVLLGVALAIAILLLRSAGQALFGQTEYGYDVIVGVGKGSKTQLVMNCIYHIDQSPGNVPYWVYEQLNTQTRPPRGSREFDFHKHVKLAVPISVGDVYQGRPIIGTLPKMFISLDPLKKLIDNLMQQERGLIEKSSEHRSSPQNLPADLAARQTALVPQIEQLKQQMIQTDRQTVPLLQTPSSDPNAPPAEFKYGNPAFVLCDDVSHEIRAAGDALAQKKPAEAIAHQNKAYDLLQSILISVSAASGPLEYMPGKSMELEQGRMFHPWKFEAVIGSEVARKTDLRLGSKFKATHGVAPPGVVPETHPEQWQVVGVLKPTHTAADRGLYIPLLTFYSIAEHEVGLAAHEQARSGRETTAGREEPPKYQLVYGDQLLPDLPHTKDYLSLDVPPNEWEVSAILIESRGGVLGQELVYYIANGGIPDVQAAIPAEVMSVFFQTFLKSSADVLLLISLLVSIVAGVGILVSIYNSVTARTREIAILRALGATRWRILMLICAEAGLIGIIGALLGLLIGHALGGISSFYLNAYVGQGFNWVSVRLDEWAYVLIVTAIALLAGLVPALKAYQTPVATNLVAT